MPTVHPKIPTYPKKHHANGQARIKLSGREFYLGVHGSRESKQEYQRLIAEWVAGGFCLHSEDERATLTVSELCLDFLRYARTQYRPNSLPAIKATLKLWRTHYGDTLTREFSPLALTALRDKMIEAGLSRITINDRIFKVKRVLKWAASKELIPVEVLHRAGTVESLRRGRGGRCRRCRPIASRRVHSSGSP